MAGARPTSTSPPVSARTECARLTSGNGCSLSFAKVDSGGICRIRVAFCDDSIRGWGVGEEGLGGGEGRRNAPFLGGRKSGGSGGAVRGTDRWGEGEGGDDDASERGGGDGGGGGVRGTVGGEGLATNKANSPKRPCIGDPRTGEVVPWLLYSTPSC